MKNEEKAYMVVKNAAEWLYKLVQELGEMKDGERAENEGPLSLGEGIYALIRAKQKISTLQNDEVDNLLVIQIAKFYQRNKDNKYYSPEPYINFQDLDIPKEVDFIDTVSYTMSVYGLALQDEKLRKKMKEFKMKDNTILENDLIIELNNLVSKILKGYWNTNDNKNHFYSWIFYSDYENIRRNLAPDTALRFNVSAYFTYSIVSALSDIYSIQEIDNKEQIKSLIANIMGRLMSVANEIREGIYWNEILDEFPQGKQLNWPPIIISTTYVLLSLIIGKNYFDINENNNINLKNLDKIIKDGVKAVLEYVKDTRKTDIDQIILYPMSGILTTKYMDETGIFEIINLFSLYNEVFPNDDLKGELTNQIYDLISYVIKNYEENYKNKFGIPRSTSFEEMFNENRKMGFKTGMVKKPAIYITSPGIDSLIDYAIREEPIDEKIKRIFNEFQSNIIENVNEYNKESQMPGFDLKNIYLMVCDTFLIKDITWPERLPENGTHYINSYFKIYEELINRNDTEIPRIDAQWEENAEKAYTNLFTRLKIINRITELKQFIDGFKRESCIKNQCYYLNEIKETLNNLEQEIKKVSQDESKKDLMEDENYFYSIMIDKLQNLKENLERRKVGVI